MAMIPIFILGPTASGKTAVAKALAKLIDGEIISADSRQVYKYLDIGTNKEGAWESTKNARVTDGIVQHLTDIIEPDETYSAGRFLDSASKIITELQNRNKTPIITGGTGLYIKALVDGLAPLPDKDIALRQKLNDELNKNGTDYFYQRLEAVDPASAQKNKNNPQRLLRALEVYMLTGTPLSQLHANTKPFLEKFVQFGLMWPRPELYNSIDSRSSVMLKSGMIEETKAVLDKGFSKYSPGIQSIGYSSIIEHLEGKITYETMEAELQRSTRNYAKRQMTWFNKDKRIIWIQAGFAGLTPDGAALLIVNNIRNLI